MDEQDLPPANIRELVKNEWIPDRPDHRDIVFHSPLSAPRLPSHVNIIGIRNKIENQHEIGSCTGNAATSALEIAIGTRRPFSRLMAYYNAREQRGTTNQDSGASIRNVMKGLLSVGVSYEETWPYITSKFAERPSALAYAEARAFANRMWGYEYVSIRSLTDVKTALAQGSPVTFGFGTPEWFLDPNFNNIIRFPSSQEKIVGGHAVVAVGYDDRYRDKIIWVRNSWGKNWGINGYFKMTQDWFTRPEELATDCWVIRHKVNPVDPNKAR